MHEDGSFHFSRALSSNKAPVQRNLSPKQNEKLSKKQQNIERVISLVQQGEKVLIFMRGLPGSGKSFLSHKIVSSLQNANPKDHIYSADDFFIHKGVYQYNPNKISEAHAWNQARAIRSMKCYKSPIIIDNTNLLIWEMKPYAVAAANAGYIIEILEPDTHWLFNVQELSRRNSHNVPKDKIKFMMQKYEKNITPEKLALFCNIRLHKPYNALSKNVSNYSDNWRNECDSSSNLQNIGFQCSTSNIRAQPVKEVPIADLISFASSPPVQEKNNIVNAMSEFEKEKIIQDIQNEWEHYNNQTTEAATSSNEETLCPFPLLSSTQLQSTYNFPQVRKNSNELKFNLETWGLGDNALVSWDIPDSTTLTNVQNQPNKVESIESSTQTENIDQRHFHLWKSITPREFIPAVVTKDHNPTFKLMLDKSAMTEEVMEIEQQTDDKFEDLCNMFQDLQRSTLRDIFEKCNCDVEWAAELLLDDNRIQLPDIVENVPEPAPEQEHIEQMDVAGSLELKRETEEEKQRKLQLIQQQSEEIKGMLESRVKINDDNYSKHILKLKKRRGDIVNIVEDPCTSTATHDANEESDAESAVSDESVELMELNMGDQLINQIETKFGDSNLTYPRGFQPVIEVPVSFARQLYAYYIESIFRQFDAQKEVLLAMQNEDEEFAERLQLLEYKDHLENNELFEEASGTSEPNLRDIMTEEAVLSKFRKENEKWKNETPDNLAFRLTKQKLFTTFPEIPEITLLELLQAHDNNYKDTVDCILLSNPNFQMNKSQFISEPPISTNTIEEMKEAQVYSNNFDIDNEKPASECREEANNILQKRKEFQQRAQSYYAKGMTDVAMFYSNLAREQTQKYNLANTLAAQKFVYEQVKYIDNYETLDLHFLKLKEALTSLDLFIDQTIVRLQQSKESRKQQFIITGRGRHSKNGVSVLRPAVIDRLEKRRIGYALMNPGLIKMVVLRNSKLTTNL